jgi:hypothetical protein
MLLEYRKMLRRIFVYSKIHGQKKKFLFKQMSLISTDTFENMRENAIN